MTQGICKDTQSYNTTVKSVVLPQYPMKHSNTNYSSEQNVDPEKTQKSENGYK